MQRGPEEWNSLNSHKGGLFVLRIVKVSKLILEI